MRKNRERTEPMLANITMELEPASGWDGGVKEVSVPIYREYRVFRVQARRPKNRLLYNFPVPVPARAVSRQFAAHADCAFAAVRLSRRRLCAISRTVALEKCLVLGDHLVLSCTCCVQLNMAWLYLDTSQSRSMASALAQRSAPMIPAP